ncbi:MAG: PAS domain S-box protein [Burkholderiales bacterium]
MKKPGLRFRINLVITIVILVFTVATGDLLLKETRRAIREETEAGSKVTAQLLETVIAGVRTGASEAQREPVLHDFLRQVGRVRANEIRLYDQNDKLIYTSPPPVYKQGLWAPAWFERLMDPKLPQFRLNFMNGSVVVTPDPSRAILDAWDDLKVFVWLMLGFFVLLNLAVFWLLGRSLEPIARILHGLSQMEAGRFDTRLPDFKLPEFEAISHTFNRMAQTLEDSLAENRRLALVARQSSDAIIIHDLEGRISFWNPAAERMFGYRTEEITGRSATLLAPDDRKHEIQDNLNLVTARKLVDMTETLRLTKDGHIVEVALSAAPLVDPAHDVVIGEICSMRDITEHKRVRQAEFELAQNKQLTQYAQARLEDERRAIARELHDELGQCLTAIKTIGTAIANRTRESSPEIHSNAQTVVSVASHIYDVVHGIIRQLRPTALDHLGLGEALKDIVSTWQSRHPEIVCDLAIDPDIDGFAEAVNITAYRIIQECLTNVIRHAAATRVEIRVTRDEESSLGDSLRILVRDNGKGISRIEETTAARFGLMGMRERVQSLGGKFDFEGQPGEGVSVSALIPLNAPPPGRDVRAA